MQVSQSANARHKRERELARKRETKVCCPEREARCHQVMRKNQPRPSGKTPHQQTNRTKATKQSSHSGPHGIHITIEKTTKSRPISRRRCKLPKLLKEIKRRLTRARWQLMAQSSFSQRSRDDESRERGRVVTLGEQKFSAFGPSSQAQEPGQRGGEDKLR